MKMNFKFVQLKERSQGTSESIVFGNRLDDKSSIPDRGKEFLF
jgi:hypothetical protein